MSEVKLKMEALNKMLPMNFMDDESVKQSFISMNMKVRGSGEGEAEMFYNREAMYLKRILFDSTKTGNEKNNLCTCTVFSLYSCFMDIAVNGLSFERAANLTYIEKRGYKIGTQDGKDIWENRASLKISPYGELALRMEMGQIRYADTPVIVYEGEKFQIRYFNGMKVIDWECTIPRKSKRIVGSFIKLTRPDGSIDFPYLGQEEIDRLKKFSEKQNQGKASYLYGTSGQNGAQDTEIDSGFLAAKTIKHAFKSYPKVLIRGTNTTLEEMDMEEDMNLPPLAAQPPLPSSSPSASLPNPVAPVEERHENKADFSPAPTQEEKGVVKTDEDDTF